MKAFMIIIFAAFTTLTVAQSKATANHISKEIAALNSNDKDTEKKAFVFPAYQGGKKALSTYIAQNLDYPDLAKENGIEGMVIIEFYIAEDGSIEKVGVDKSLGFGCDEAALNVVKHMPSWSPAQLRGKNITKKMKKPIYFSLR